MRTKGISTLMITLFLANALFTVLYINSAFASPGAKVAIDITRLSSYTPSFSTASSLLATEGYTVDVLTTGSITAERLEPYCALIICWPQTAYTEDEVNAIMDFIEAGRGLLFLGDYGKNWYSVSGGVYPSGANDILGPMGISINDDEVYDPTDYHTNTFWPLIDTFPVTHPVTSCVSTFMPEATASLSVSSPGVTIATGDDDSYAVDPAEADPEGDSPTVVVGIAGSYEPVLAASTFGRGRLVVAGDHNWIVDGIISIYDNTQLFINTIKWLCQAWPLKVGKELVGGSEDTPEFVPIFTQVRFDLKIKVENADDDTALTDILLEDGIGADLDLVVQDPDGIADTGDEYIFKVTYPDATEENLVFDGGDDTFYGEVGAVSWKQASDNAFSKGKRCATVITWDIGTLSDGEVITLEFSVETNTHTIKKGVTKQSYTSTCHQELNSGPEVKYYFGDFLDCVYGNPLVVSAYDPTPEVDSDLDGFVDLDEVAAGTDPCDPDDYPMA